MLVKEHLFYFIKSLTTAEKRYFKLFIGKKKEVRDYLLLFDTLDKLDSYDEAFLIQKFKDKKFIKWLPTARDYLYKLLLKSMRAYRVNGPVSDKVSNLIINANIFAEKKLYTQALKQLKKAKKLATESHHELRLIEINKLIRSIKNRAAMLLFEEASDMERSYKADINLLEQQIELREYQYLYDRIFLLSKRRLNQLKENEQSELSEIMNHTLVKDGSKKKAFYSVLIYYSVWALYYSIQNKATERLECLSQMIQHFEDNHTYQSHTTSYLPILGNYLTACFNSERYQSFPSILQKIKQMPFNNFEQQYIYFNNILYLEFLYYINTGQLEEGLKMVPVLEKGLNKYERDLHENKRLAISYNVALLYMFVSDFKSMLQWINKIVLNARTKVRRDIQNFALIFQIIGNMETEQGNVVFLHNLCASNRRQLSRKKQLGNYEKCIFSYLRKIAETINKQDLKNLCKQLKAELATIKKNSQKDLMGYYEIGFWLNYKIDNIPIRKQLLKAIEKDRTSS